MTPRSTSEITGISGSGISASAAQTRSGRQLGRDAHQTAPGTERRTHRHLVPQRRPAVGVGAALDRIGVGRSRDRRGPPPPRRGTARAGRPRGARARTARARSRPALKCSRPSSDSASCAAHICAWIRWYASSRSIFCASPATSGRSEAEQARIRIVIRRLVEVVPRDRRAPVVDEPQLDELRRAVLLGLAVERQLVGGRPQLGGGQLVPRARVADLASARSTRTRRPPRGTARCRSTPSRASRARARRRRASMSCSTLGGASEIARLLQFHLERVAVHAPVVAVEHGSDVGLVAPP